MERASLWLRSPAAARVLDVVLVVGLFGIGVAGHVAARTDSSVEAGPLGVAMVVYAALAASLVWWRRRFPLWMVASFAVVLSAADGASPPGLYAGQVGLELAVLCFAVGSWSDRPRTAVAVSVLLTLAIVSGALDDGSNLLQATSIGLVLVAFPLVAGYASRVRRRYVEEVEQRLVQAERDREARARRAVEQERTRIARELHDVVAHHVSLIGVQAGAARRTLVTGAGPEATEDALRAIEASSREAVGEMRQLLDVLRPLPAAETASEAPQPGLHALPALVDRWRAAGFTVGCEARGLDAEPPLPPTLSLSCYRVIEESLTNVARHSTARSAEVEVDVGADAVEIAVHDPGPARVPANADPASAAGAPPNSGGRGLIGMAERVALFGGRLSTGTTPEGGFVVEAVLPRSLA
jgi:signal transduction histidine kinase